jgi:hypothetical protein
MNGSEAAPTFDEETEAEFAQNGFRLEEMAVVPRVA